MGRQSGDQQWRHGWCSRWQASCRAGCRAVGRKGACQRCRRRSCGRQRANSGQQHGWCCCQLEGRSGERRKLLGRQELLGWRDCQWRRGAEGERRKRMLLLWLLLLLLQLSC